MKYKLLIIIFFIISIYAQFSSGVDYSVKKFDERQKEIGSVIYLEKYETEWNVNFGIGNKFAARSDLNGFGYGIFGKYPVGDLSITFNGDHIIREISNSASLDTNSVLTNKDLPAFSFQEIKGSAGIKYKNTYGLYGNILHFCVDEGGETANQLGINGEYNFNFEGKKNLEVFYDFNISENDSILKELKTVSEINPEQMIGMIYSVFFDKSKLCTTFKYFSYNDAVSGDKKAEYMNFEIEYERKFFKTKSSISASLGTNLTSDLETPEIYLPFFYNTVELSNRLYEDKINLTIGWNYKLFYSVLSDRKDFTQFEELLSLNEVKENTGTYKLFVKLSYKY
ncbi:MAG: hypothetical protein KKD38_05300 [Candidatus Delongbacteria bacterium]|nr:hypothetical protein [Candidatus Delongbacteria bacterium]